MKFNKKLILNSYLLSLFGVESFDELSKDLKNPRLESLDENDNSLFYHRLKDNLFEKNKLISNDKLLEYDENIVRHTKTMGRGIRWKYFQYLSLLFVEIYLDRYFDDKEQLLQDLNTYLKEFNTTIDNNREKLTEYDDTELNKLALYNATGSGKTLLLHINLMQFNHYCRDKINKTILITPNAGLSNQHLEEFQASNIEAEIFSKDSKGLFESNAIEIIEITKLGDEEGDKTVAVDSFEDNNLVFIDEGHRGAKGEIWKINRDKLSKKGFAFEYSATFAQVINSSTGKKRKELENEYAKAIIFDYSYRYFYNDGYGKDYSILNLNEDSNEIKPIYLTASLLSFYQQMKIYESSRALLKSYLIEKPLMVFVGASVNAVRKRSGKDVSDVVDVLLFLNEFIKNRVESIANIERVMSLDSGLQNSKGVDIFYNKFSFLESRGLDALKIFEDILKSIFNTSSGQLHIERLKGIDGEIALRVGENEYFGVINVGDSDKLIKLCENNGMSIRSRDFSNSLFKSINHKTSPLNILIGSKKFSEGWSSWRVSTMGLMNVGKKEGSQIIQLFGRGVRLKGYDFCLKRSNAITGYELERKYRSIETLNIFGLQSDYMKSFREYLKNEGVPTNDRVEFILPLKYNNRYKTKKLKVLDLQDGKNFKREMKLDLDYLQTTAIHKQVLLSLYKSVDELESQNRGGDKLELNSEIVTNSHLSFINIDNIFFALQEFKNERGWSNLNISKKHIENLIAKSDWYTLLIPKDDMKIESFKHFAKFENIMITLLKKYTKSFYEYKRSEWESKFLEYRELDEIKDRANLIDNYAITVEDKEIELITILEKLEKSRLLTFDRADLKVFNSATHLYNPLIYTNKGMTSLSIKPIELNSGEKDFVMDLAIYLENNHQDDEVFLLRNQSKTGFRFFTNGNFYPDFIMWLIKNNRQYITFIDPKGIRNSNPKDDPKINLAIKIKEIERTLGDKSIVLNSFILSNTSLRRLNELHTNLTYQFFDEKNVLFQVDNNRRYIDEMFEKILAN